MPPTTPRYFAAAPWPKTLKAVSLIGSILLCVISYAAYVAVPAGSGFTRAFGIAVALVPLLVLGGSLLSIVRGYSVDSNGLAVRRLVTRTRVSLVGLKRIWVAHDVCKGSVRVFGNGGLFSFSGWFYSKPLGRYRMFATDVRNAVVLRLPARVIVVSPAAPEEFVELVQRLMPGVLPAQGRSQCTERDREGWR